MASVSPMLPCASSVAVVALELPAVRVQASDTLCSSCAPLVCFLFCVLVFRCNPLSALCRYYELLDTVLLIVKKRPLSFLHVYHHCVVLILFWAYNQSRMVISWVLVVANSVVHVAMYGYFTAATFGVTVWWKKYITQAQIVQFVVDLTATWPFPVLYYGTRGCSGSMRGWLFGQAVGFSFFHLFVSFYRRSYKKADATPAVGAITPAEGVAAPGNARADAGTAVASGKKAV